MFESLTDKLELTFKRLRGQGKITENNIDDALREVRLGLLGSRRPPQSGRSFSRRGQSQGDGSRGAPEPHAGAAVHRNRARRIGRRCWAATTSELDLKAAPPVVIMLVGLQGSGKTTTLAKLARYLKNEKKRTPYLVPADIYRPAAIEQLKILGKELDLPVYDSNPETSPVAICRQALDEAKKKFCDVLLIDTAGRLHIDEELMQELSAIKEAVNPHQILFVADSMTGQDAVNQALGFDGKLGVSGHDPDQARWRRPRRRGAVDPADGRQADFIFRRRRKARCSRTVLSRPAGIAHSRHGRRALADRQGAAKRRAEGSREAPDRRFRKQQFTLEEFQVQLQQIKRMGSMGSLLEMIPGGKKLASQVDAEKAEKELKRVEAIINSMTIQERRNPALLNGSRRRRIAEGSGTTVTDINRLMKQFLEMKKMMQRVSKLGVRSLMSQMPNPFH